MDGRKKVGLCWLIGIVGCFMITMEPGSAPNEYEALGLLMAFVLVGGMWTALMLVIGFFFTKGDKS